MPPVVRRRGSRVPVADQPVVAPPAVRTRRSSRSESTPPPRSDGFETTGSRTRQASEPFKALASRGEFAGYLKIASGQVVFVSVKLGKDASKKPPLIMLDGIAARYERNTAFEDLVKKSGQSIVSIYLPGQGETLAKDMAAGGASLRSDIEQEDQAKTVIGVLDALGIKNQVGVAGLSYGGAIAAQCEAQYPDRFSKVMVVAPYVRSQGSSNPWSGMLNNPWNPWGASMYRAAVKSTLTSMFNYTPDVLKAHPGAFHEGLYRLTMGLEDYDLKDTVRGMKDLHFLVVPEDGASPPEQNKDAFNGVGTGSFTSAPASEAGNHDLVRANGPLVAKWLSDVMTDRVKASKVG
jgi:pimeloyl-ACP methyl ester carboxylesterase